MMASSYTLGLFFILLVDVIWSLASIMVQFLYTDEKFDSPFLLTYIGTSLFILFLPTRFLWERRYQFCYYFCRCCCCCCFCFSTVEADNNNIAHPITTPWKTQHTNSSSYQPLQSVEYTTSSLDHHQQQQHVAVVVVENDDDDNNNDTEKWSHERHFQTAMKIAPVWFVANWAYNASLEYTSITSSTVLASTGSVFTFLFAVAYGDEVFTCLKLSGVLLGVAGSCLTGWHDVHDNNNTHNNNDHDSSNNDATVIMAAAADNDGTVVIWGDVLGLLSAVGYGAYAVMIRILCDHDESKMSMQLLLGYIGLINLVSLSPIALYVVVGHAGASSLTWIVLGYVIAKGLLDNVLSDYLWARAVVLTSATVATVGLGLTIPLAFLSDVILGHQNVISVQSVIGALAVLCGFVLVNLGDKHNDENDGEETESVVDDDDDDDGSPTSLCETTETELYNMREQTHTQCT